jgi:hypothetical protein
MTARVVSVSGRRVTLVPAGDLCFGCVKGNCGKRPAPLIIECRGGPVPVPGQLVETGLSPGALIGETLYSVLIPAAGFIAGFFLARLLFPHAGEGARAAAGVLFLFPGGLILYLIRRRFPPGSPLRTIRIVEAGGRPGVEGNGSPPAGRRPDADAEDPAADHGEAGIALPVLYNPGIFESGA